METSATETPDSTLAPDLIRLTRGRGAEATASGARAWEETLEAVTHRAIRSLWMSPTMDLAKPEGIAFVRALARETAARIRVLRRETPELGLFRRPVALFSFQLRDRRYVCMVRPVVEDGDPGRLPAEEVRRALHRVGRAMGAGPTALGDRPSAEELVSILVHHLDRTCHSRQRDNDPLQGRPVEVHAAIRGALQNWQMRRETSLRVGYRHGPEEPPFFGYPVMSGLVPDGRTLLLLLMSPLDNNFVDEKIPSDHRIAQVSFALFDVADGLSPGILKTVVRDLRSAFARVLFTAMLGRSARALSNTFEEQSCITRYWLKIASDGLHGILGENLRTNPFDPLGFCEAIVKKVLCADIPGVENTELFPFDRVFIFREAGTSSRFRVDEPIEVRVLEASILSNNPADRAGYLTRRERRLRGTEDFECDASKKRINPDDVFHFYIHGTEEGLFLSRRPEPPEQMDPAARSSGVGAQDKYYYIGKPALNEGNEISEFLYNLLGRLVPETRGKKEIPDPSDPGRVFCATNTFREAFEKHRQRVLQRADDAGLYYRHEHGLDLALEIPTLMQIQRAYAEYLADHFGSRDEQFLRDSYRRDNVPEPEIERLLESHKRLRRRRSRAADLSVVSVDNGATDGRNRAKTVLVAFSWDLHDENMRMAARREEDGTEEPLLGEDYCFTMILVADEDPEKSMARLQAEREDLKLFFQMLMRQIWMDRRKEYEYLERKSRTIANSLFQFTHRVKGLLPRGEDRREIDLFYTRLKELIRPVRTPVRIEEVRDGLEVLGRLVSLEEAGTGLASLETALRELVTRWGTLRELEPGRVNLQVLPSPVPNLRVSWCAPVVNDAFHVVLKNACEAAFPSGGAEDGRVDLQVQAVPRADGRDAWFLDVVVQNTGGPVPEPLLRKLNAPDPDPLERNPRKEGSTGFGIYLSRYQMQQVIGEGADVRVENVGDGTVQTRIRLPATLVTRVGVEEQEAVHDVTGTDGPYVLYVEDDPGVYQLGLQILEAAAAPSNTTVVHCRGYLRALAFVRKQSPRLVAADMNIPLGEETGSRPRTKYGVALVRGVMEQGAATGERPPVVVLTGEEEAWVREQIGEVSPHGYRFLPAVDGFAETLGRGDIAILSGQKRPETLRRVGQWLGAEGAGSGPGGGGVPWVQLPLDAIGKKRELQEAVDSASSSRGVVVVTAPGGPSEQIVQILTAWFRHPGVPDPESVAIGDRGLYRLTDHGYHQRLVLLVPLARELWARMPVGVSYWGLLRNVWMGPAPAEPSHVAAAWQLLRHEGRGPLSTVRHDLHNLWIAPALGVVLEQALSAIGRAEGLVAWPERQQRRLETCLARGTGGMKVWESLLRASPEAVQQARAEAGKALNDVERILAQGFAKEPGVEEPTRRRMSTIHQLRAYLRGGPR